VDTWTKLPGEDSWEVTGIAESTQKLGMLKKRRHDMNTQKKLLIIDDDTDFVNGNYFNYESTRS
jgi:hypothetical protein